MKTKIISVFTAVLLALGLTVGTTAPAQAGLITKAYNNCNSAHRVLVATGLNGGGTRYYVNPCNYSPKGVASVYIHYTKSTSKWTTSISGNTYSNRGWVNTAHWLGVKTISVTPWIISV